MLQEHFRFLGSTRGPDSSTIMSRVSCVEVCGLHLMAWLDGNLNTWRPDSCTKFRVSCVEVWAEACTNISYDPLLTEGRDDLSGESLPDENMVEFYFSDLQYALSMIHVMETQWTTKEEQILLCLEQLAHIESHISWTRWQSLHKCLKQVKLALWKKKISDKLSTLFLAIGDRLDKKVQWLQYFDHREKVWSKIAVLYSDYHIFHSYSRNKEVA